MNSVGGIKYSKKKWFVQNAAKIFTPHKNLKAILSNRIQSNKWTGHKTKVQRCPLLKSFFQRVYFP